MCIYKPYILKIFKNILLLGLLSCTIQPEKIEYGKDTCHFCKMLVIDPIHGAEIVTKKGKVFKFDAIECMLNYTNEMNSSESIALYLVNHYESAEDLIPAKAATYLQSPQIKSPMGENLTAFENANHELLRNKKTSDVREYSWQELKELFAGNQSKH